VLPCQLDVTEPDSIDRVRARLEAEYGQLHALINRAAILYDTWQQALNADFDAPRRCAS
jgi:NAD(P)-dependent dehydrogenase (short-subunit alcohol dehydrogenase family)